MIVRIFGSIGGGGGGGGGSGFDDGGARIESSLVDSEFSFDKSSDAFFVNDDIGIKFAS